MAVAMGVGRFVYTPILPEMLAQGAVDPAGAGWLAGGNFLGYLLGAMAAGGRFWFGMRRPIFAFALAASVATTLAMAVFDAFWVMMALRFLSGLASAFAMIFVSSIVLDWLAGRGRPDLAWLHFGGVGVGIAVSAILVSIAAGVGADWQQRWLVAGLAALAGWLFSVSSIPARTASAANPGAGIEHAAPAIEWRPLALLTLSYGLFGFGYVITATFLNTLARSSPALANVEPYVWAVVGLSAAPSVIFWNAIARRTGVAWAYAIACLAEAGGIAASLLVPAAATLIACAGLLGGTFIAVTALGLQEARRLAPEAGAGPIAWMTASFGLGQMIGPIVAGQMFQATGKLDAASWLAAIVLAAAALAALASRTRPVSRN